MIFGFSFFIVKMSIEIDYSCQGDFSIVLIISIP